MRDLISRRSVINALAEGKEFLNRALDDMYIVGNEREKYEWGIGLLESYIADVTVLPAAQPKRKNGKWTEQKVVEDRKAIEEWQSARCSVCWKYHTTPYLYYFDYFAYCPNCWAKMDERREK